MKLRGWGRILFAGILVFFCGLANSLKAQDFFAKEKDGKIAKFAASFHLNDDQSIQFYDSSSFRKILSDGSLLTKGKILARDPSKAEEAVDAAALVFTGLLIMATHKSYDLTPTVRMSSMRGLLFFIMPFESHLIYRKCSKDASEREYLVASSDVPSEDLVKDMLSKEEVDVICGTTKNVEKS